MEQYITRIVDPWDINDINDFLNSSRHRFSYDSAKYPIEYSKVFLNGLVDDLKKFLQLYEIKDKTSLVIQITSSLERASEYIELNGKQVIILDIHQIYECVDAIILTCLAELGSSTLVDWDMEKLEELVARQDDIAKLCAEHGIDKETFYEFLTQHEIDNDVIAPNYLHNLADIYFTMGYVDASMVCLNIIKDIPIKDIEINEEYDYAVKLPEMIPEFIIVISRFVIAHELNHIMINNNIVIEKLQQKLLKRLLLAFFDKINQEELNSTWKHCSGGIKKRNKKYSQVVKDLIGDLSIDDHLKEELDTQLSRLLLQWSVLDTNEITDSDSDFEELYCDMEAINIINSYLNDRIEISFNLTTIMKFLMVQETYNLQKNIVLFLTHKTKEISSNFIIRIQMLFCCLVLVLDYSSVPEEFRELMLFRTMDFDDDRKKRLIKELSDALDLLHEVYYIPAIINAINSFQPNIVHKEMNMLCFGENKKKIVLDETYWNSQQIKQNTRVGNIDFIVYQKQIMHLYLEYKAYCFKNRV